MLVLITNRKIVNVEYLQVIEKAIDGGISAIILREKDLDSNALYSLALKIKKIINGREVKLIINGNLEVAKKINAYAYHCSFKEFINEKPILNKKIGVSVHSLEEAIMAEKNGASYLLISHIYETDCKKDLEPKGVQFIEEVKKNTEIPVIALGGITLENIKEVLKAGADGVAIMSGIMSAKEPDVVARKMKENFK